MTSSDPQSDFDIDNVKAVTRPFPILLRREKPVKFYFVCYSDFMDELDKQEFLEESRMVRFAAMAAIAASVLNMVMLLVICYITNKVGR